MNPGTIRARASDGHAWDLIVVDAQAPGPTLLWLPALGIAARHYLPFAHAVAACGMSVAVHEWRGHGSSTLRASRHVDWGYRELLERDVPASIGALNARAGARSLSIGGHSLGGQLACCAAALAPGTLASLHLVASGMPYWRAFPRPLRYGLPLAYRFLPWLARVHGALPGRRIGFGGTEAAGVMRDWAHTALSGRYEVRGWPVDIEHLLGQVDAPLTAVTLTEDWFAPPSSLDCLLGKMPRAPQRALPVDGGALGVRADHFAWMRAPGHVARRLVDR